MAGLLDALDVLLEGSQISVSVDAQLGPLGEVTGSVQALVDGPDTLADLEASIAAVPLPPGLEGLVSVPTDLAAALALLDIEGGFGLDALLGPLQRIAGEDLSVDGMLQMKGVIHCFRQALELITRQASGPSGFPLPAELWGRQDFVTELSPEDIAARVADLDALLDGIGPHLDGAAVIDALRRIAPYWRHQMNEWPTIPVLSDVMEIAGVAVEWAAMGGPELTSHLDGRLGTLAEVIALPRSRVAEPLVAQATVAAELPVVLASAGAELTPLLDHLRRKVTEWFAKPTPTELRTLETQVRALETVTAALSLDGTPLGRLDRLVRDLELHLMRAVRAVIPPFDTGGVTGLVDGLLAGIPEPVDAPLAEAVTAVEELDLSFLTGPIAAVRGAVEAAVDEIEGALGTVRDQVTGLLEPAADALDQVLAAAGIADLQAELAGLPATIQDVVDTEIGPALEPITTAVADAVAAIDAAAALFDPEALIAPLRAAIEDVADLVVTDEVGDIVAEVERAVQTAVDVLAEIDFAAAADGSIDLMADIEVKLAEIDLGSIPEALHQPLKQAVDVVADIDFTAEVGGPLAAGVGAALVAGPQEVLNLIQEHSDRLRISLERFKPSVVIGDAIDAPFEAMLGELDAFAPSDLLGRVSEALQGLAGQVGVLDPDAVIAPLVAVHAELVAAVEAIRPSNLLAPVDEAIAAAIAKVFEVTGVDDIFDGIDDVIGTVRGYVDIARAASVALTRVAELLGNPGDVDAALEALVTGLTDQLDDVELSTLGPRFDELAAVSASVGRSRLAADIVGALRKVQAAVPPALPGPVAHDLCELVRAFPLHQLEGSRDVPARRRLASLIRRLLAVCDRIETAAGPWSELAADIDRRAPRLEADLVTYARLTVIDGRDVFAGCIAAPTTIADLHAAVRAAAHAGLELPVTALFGLFARLAPHVASVAAGLGDVIGAVHAKLDSITGSEGIGGLAQALEEVADLLRDLDLSPLTDPLDAVFGRLETAVGALDPAPLGDALRAAAEAIAGLLDVTALVDDATVASLDAAYASAVAKLRSLAPGALVGDTLDPVYEGLLSSITPLLELAGRLSELLGSVGAGLSADVVVQLRRVEAAFDAMLRAIPFNGAAVGGSVSVSGSVSVGGP